MLLYTSCFERAARHPRVVSGELRVLSIAYKNPDGWDQDAWAPSLRPLEHIEHYWTNRELTQYGYDRLMREQRLQIVAAQWVVNYYPNAVFACWEPPRRFCHRHLIRRWIYEETGIFVEELGFPDMRWPETWSTVNGDTALPPDSPPLREEPEKKNVAIVEEQLSLF